MNKRVCVIVGEGKSEKTFLSSLLVNQFDFKESEDKGCIVFNSNKDRDLYWIFPFPSLGIKHEGGYGMLQCFETYLDCKPAILNKSYIWGKTPKLYYRIITDTDNDSREIIEIKRSKILSAIKKANVGAENYKVSFANIEIESWFIAGLDVDSSLVDINQKKTAEKLINSFNVESIIDPKEKLDEILNAKISGNRQSIGNEFGEYINIEQAILKSKSFKKFIEDLKKDNLLI